MYGAEGYAPDRHGGFGRVMKNIGKTAGHVGIGIGRVLQPELKPLYDIGDRALNQIRGNRLEELQARRVGMDPRTWQPRGTEALTRQ